MNRVRWQFDLICQLILGTPTVNYYWGNPVKPLFVKHLMGRLVRCFSASVWKSGQINFEGKLNLAFKVSFDDKIMTYASYQS